MISRLGLLFALLASFFAGPGAAQSFPEAAPDRHQPGTRKNVLFIISDDLHAKLGCYGDPLVKTPNIDRLAARGARFSNAYCQFPLCGPSRNSLLTGMYPNSTGIVRNAQIFRHSVPEAISLPQAFRLDGYFAAKVGKLYHYNVPKSVGTAGHGDPTSWELQSNPAGVDRVVEEDETTSLVPGSFGGTLSWFASPRADELHTDGMIAEDANWILKRCAERNDRPFFLAVGFYRPHTPYTSPQEYFKPYPLGKMPVVQGWQEDQQDVPPMALTMKRKIQDDMTEQQRKEVRQAYYASISFMDAQLGKVLKKLDETGLADSTYIVFTSDHGYAMGEHGMWQKLTLFEDSAQVPLIIAGPGINPGTVVDEPVGLIDVFPTLMDLTDTPSPKTLQGQSLRKLMDDPTSQGRGYALTQLYRPGNAKKLVDGYSIRTPQYRYNLWNDGEAGHELYDHQADPGEITNLADRGEMKEVVAELRSQLRAAVKATYPANGQRPAVEAMNYSPNMTEKAKQQYPSR